MERGVGERTPRGTAAARMDGAASGQDRERMFYLRGEMEPFAIPSKNWKKPYLFPSGALNLCGPETEPHRAPEYLVCK